MLLLPTTRLPEGPAWQYELKLDGYRDIAFKTGGSVHLRSKNENDFSKRFGSIARALDQRTIKCVPRRRLGFVFFVQDIAPLRSLSLRLFQCPASF